MSSFSFDQLRLAVPSTELEFSKKTVTVGRCRKPTGLNFNLIVKPVQECLIRNAPPPLKRGGDYDDEPLFDWPEMPVTDEEDEEESTATTPGNSLNEQEDQNDFDWGFAVQNKKPVLLAQTATTTTTTNKTEKLDQLKIISPDAGFPSIRRSGRITTTSPAKRKLRIPTGLSLRKHSNK